MSVKLLDSSFLQAFETQLELVLRHENPNLRSYPLKILEHWGCLTLCKPYDMAYMSLTR